MREEKGRKMGNECLSNVKFRGYPVYRDMFSCVKVYNNIVCRIYAQLSINPQIQGRGPKAGLFPLGTPRHLWVGIGSAESAGPKAGHAGPACLVSLKIDSFKT